MNAARRRASDELRTHRAPGGAEEDRRGKALVRESQAMGNPVIMGALALAAAKLTKLTPEELTADPAVG